MDSILAHISSFFENNFFSYLPAVVVLIGGIIVALIISSIVKGLLTKTSILQRGSKLLCGDKPCNTDLAEKVICKGVFYLILVYVLIAFFQMLGLEAVSGPLNSFVGKILAFLPKVVVPLLLFCVAWVLANLLKRFLSSPKFVEKFSFVSGMEPEARQGFGNTLGETAYWLVFLLFLIAVLDVLKLQGLLQPLQGMMNELFSFLPNLVAAALIFAAGWFLAKILQKVVSNGLAAFGVNKVTENAGLGNVLGSRKLSDLIGLVIFVVIFIPVLISSLNALQLDAVTRPASQMLNKIFAAAPSIVAATFVMVIAYIVARIVSQLVSNLLAASGFNNVLSHMGLLKEGSKSSKSASEILGYLVLVLIMLFASIEALRLLNFSLLATMLGQLTTFLGEILLGLVIFGVGLWISNVVSSAIRSSTAPQSKTFAMVARVAILVLAGSMALGQMGVADKIIELAFGLTLGAVAVAFALAFGLGGRDVAAESLREFAKKIKS